MLIHTGIAQEDRMRTLFQDFHYALRQLRRSMGFTATALLTIALAIGAVTTVFSVVNGVLLRPYAFHDPGQIVVWRESIREMQQVARFCRTTIGIT
jgi:hypothetical protein